MKLNKEIIERLKASREFRLAVMVALGFSELWIDKLIDKNKINGPLTTAKSLEVIRKETGLSDDGILTEELETEKQS